MAIMDIEIQNKTNSNQVYVYITGQALDKGNHVCFMKADGKTPYYPDSPSEILQPVKEDCAILLGAPGSSTTVTIPQLAGGRIWFSVDQKLTFLLNPGPAVVEPSVTNPTDPNIDITWDFCEFTFANNSIYANISYVDFISLSVSLTLTTTDGSVQKVLGLNPDGLSHVSEGLKAQNLTDSADWEKLIYSANGKELRVLSPNNAIVMTGGDLFKGYYDSYIDEVYEKYRKTPLTVNTQAQWGAIQAKVANEKLEFPGGACFPKPSTGDIFGCSSGPFANNEGALGPLTARLTAGFNRSTLLTNDNHPDNEDAANYYQHPVTNHYARLVHEANIDGRGYAFPYDDVSGGGVDQSGFVNGSPKSFIVTIG